MFNHRYCFEQTLKSPCKKADLGVKIPFLLVIDFKFMLVEYVYLAISLYDSSCRIKMLLHLQLLPIMFYADLLQQYVCMRVLTQS